VEKPCRIGVDFPDEACYLYLRDGALVVNSGTAATNLAAKDSIVLNCGSYFADFINTSEGEKSEVFAIHLHPDLLREIFRSELPSFLRSAPVTSLSEKIISHSIMDRFIESLLFYFNNPQIITEEILTLKVKELILLLVQTNHAASIHELFAAIFTRKTVSVVEVVNAHLYHNLSVDELAKLAGLSVTSFKMEFNKLYNESPARYIRKKKMERAKELLKLRDHTISEIAYQVGYNDPSHFSKSFQSLHGYSPGAYRELHSLIISFDC
jgi:AraC family transcriptional regulator, exoenzyme S synthesis regulatory protein ExsA